MGILNVTPDSFSDGGRFASVESAVEEALSMTSAGAQVIDIGGESTRPGAPEVSQAEELDRVVPVVAALRDASNVVISIDTSKADVARAAVNAGADIVNDVSGFMFDARMAEVCAETDVGCVLMHTPARSATMMRHAAYEDVFEAVSAHLAASVKRALEAGIDPSAIMLDPGFGFGKRAGDNYRLLRHLDRLSPNGFPWLAGVSRKRMIRDAVGNDAQAVAHGTAAANMLALVAGYAVLRVHDVPAAVATRDLWCFSQSVT